MSKLISTQLAPIAVTNALANRSHYERAKDLLVSVAKCIEDPKLKNKATGSLQKEILVLEGYVKEFINQNGRPYADRSGVGKLSVEELVSFANKLGDLEKVEDEVFRVRLRLTVDLMDYRKLCLIRFEEI